MRQMREFAQHKADFDSLDAKLIGISVDDQEHAHKVYEGAAHGAFRILSDPGAEVIRQYGLLHSKGHGDEDIALRTTIFINKEGKEVFRRVSETVPDVPKSAEILNSIRAAQQ
jgi:peroxiredoxin